MFESWAIVVMLIILFWVISISYDIEKLRRDIRRSARIIVTKVVKEETIEEIVEEETKK